MNWASLPSSRTSSDRAVGDHTILFRRRWCRVPLVPQLRGFGYQTDVAPDRAHETGQFFLVLGALRLFLEGRRRDIGDRCYRVEIDPVNGPSAVALFEWTFAVVWIRLTVKPAFIS
jgi:hypothetical protein